MTNVQFNAKPATSVQFFTYSLLDGCGDLSTEKLVKFEEMMRTRDTTDVAQNISSKASQIGVYIEKYGFKKTWTSLLVKQIRSSDCFDKKYMEEQVRKGRSFVDKIDDLLTGTSQVEVGILYEYALAFNSHESRKGQGQFYTPQDVADLMVAVSNFGEEHIWLDPCCGSGNLSYALAESQSDPIAFLSERLILVDKDEFALMTAAVQLTLRFASNKRGVFRKIRAKSSSTDYLKRKRGVETAVIMNPPYVSNVINKEFESSSARDIYSYFMEKVAKEVGNFVSITPQSFTNSSKFQSLRNILLRELDTLDIYCFDNVPDNVFKGVKFGSTNSNKVNSTRAAITVGKRNKIKKESASAVLRVTPLLRWRSSERSRLFSNIQSFLSVIDYEAFGLFPKLRKSELALYATMIKSKKTLRNLVSEKGEYVLHVPTMPRYFISATKRKLNRASVKELHFDKKQEMEMAYLLLNSELFYWWWRVNDGGMSLSKETMLSFPIPPGIEVNNQLVKSLAESEEVSLVIKKNHGMLAENIKHDDALVKKLTDWALDGTKNSLRDIRSNSVF